MNRPVRRWIAIVGVGLLLLLTPLFVRTLLLGYNQRAYEPGESTYAPVALTPIPTVEPVQSGETSADVAHELRPGPVVVDLAHGNRVDRNQFESLASALAQRGVGVRFWMSDIDPMTVSSFVDYPDQSDELEALLHGASGLISVSPFFMWSQEEIAQVEKFVADGGRLLIISDPDVVGDLAQDVNTLGEPFGIVFADDYLYDTADNDGNYVYIFPREFDNEAESLAGSDIVFYGSRSIGGDVVSQLRTADSTLSNLRIGLSGLNTMVTGGLESRGTLGGVLAMGDFDVLTTPFVERHDNAALTAFVADFLASGQRTMGITDFPEFLGKEVKLIIANGDAVDAKTLLESSKLQLSLEATGRKLAVGGTGQLTNTMTNQSVYYITEPQTDLIVLSDFKTADTDLTLLSELGYSLIEVMPTPMENAGSDDSSDSDSAELDADEQRIDEASEETESTVTPTPATLPTALPTALPLPDTSPTVESLPPSPSSQATSSPTPDVGETPVATPTSTPTPSATGNETQSEEPEAMSTATPSQTATQTPSPSPSSSPTPTATPVPDIYLVAEDGLRLVAQETVLIAQREMDDGRRIVTVLGYDDQAIRSGINRLLEEGFRGCVTSVDMAVCSNPEGAVTKSDADTSSSASSANTDAEEPTGDTSSEPAANTEQMVMVIDDDVLTVPSEESEAEIYLDVLTEEGYGPTLWKTGDDGAPDAADLEGYDWVIWSAGGYVSGGPSLSNMDALMAYLNDGGALTISSRRPFFGMSDELPTSISDVAVDDDLPELVMGLPSTAVMLDEESPPVVPLEIGDQHAGARVALRRGPASENAEAPLMFVVVDDEGDEATGAKMMVAGLSLTWLPDTYREQLVRNMTAYMLQD